MDRGLARVREQDWGQKQALDQSIAVMAQPAPDLALVAYDPESVDRPYDPAKSEADLLDLDAQRQDLLDRELARKQRRRYSGLIFLLAVCWLLGVYVAVLGHGLQKFYVPGLGWAPFSLSDTIIVAMVGSTAVTGLLGIVVANLFPGRTG